jgi:hypothetical protein
LSFAGPLISDETFERSQVRFTERPRRQSSNSGRNYLFAGMVRCQTGHQPLSMRGNARKGHHYYACSYGSTYGDTAAGDVHAGQKWIYLREDALLPLVEQFFAQRVLGPVRLDKLARQLRLQIQALEDSIDGELVSARIAELRADRQAAEDALARSQP